MTASKTKAPAKKAVSPTSMRRLAIIGGVGAISFLLLFFMTDQPQSAPSKRIGPSAKKAVTVKYIPERVKTKNLAVYAALYKRDLFKPLIGDKTDDLTISDKKNIDQVKGWSYIGSVSVDNVPYALLQQSGSGDSGYYRVGENIEGMTIKAIQPNQLVLGSPDQNSIHLPITSGLASSATQKSSDAGGDQRIARNAPDANANPIAAGSNPANPNAAASANDGSNDNANQSNSGNFNGRRSGFQGGGRRGGGRRGGGFQGGGG